MGFREAREKELKIIKRALRFFNPENFENFFDKYKIFIKNKKEVFIIPKELYSFLNSLNLSNLNPISIGVKIGEIRRRFRLTLEGSFLISKNERKRVYVNEKGEMLFLYGRDIFAMSVERVSDDVRENDTVFVCNKRGDVLGLGRSRFNADRFFEVEDERIVVDNLVDRGEYLRKDKLYDAY